MENVQTERWHLKELRYKDAVCLQCTAACSFQLRRSQNKAPQNFLLQPAGAVNESSPQSAAEPPSRQKRSHMRPLELANTAVGKINHCADARNICPFT